MEFPSFSECVMFICGAIGFGGIGGYIDRGEGLIGSVCLLAVSGLLALCAKIGNKNKRK